MRDIPMRAFRTFLNFNVSTRKSRTTKNIQVLTFCVDYEYMHAHDYMNQEKYTFPVIADWALANKLFPADKGCSYGLPSPTGEKALASSGDAALATAAQYVVCGTAYLGLLEVPTRLLTLKGFWRIRQRLPHTLAPFSPRP
jgi:hypothetical protein